MTFLYTYSEARNKLAEVLRRVDIDGEVMIKKRDGKVYVLRPAQEKESPLDVEVIEIDISTNEVVDIIREIRERA